jgi:transcriptional regulator with XRE-family HTH domain
MKLKQHRPVQPARMVLVSRRITLRKAAAAIGVTEHWLGKVLSGQQTPSHELRAALAEFLDLPEDQLFTYDCRGRELAPS